MAQIYLGNTKIYKTLVGNTYNGIESITFDSDAVAFFDATGITDVTIKNAVNQLVLDLKNDGIWTKMIAIYPFVGGSANTHKYNLKDPRDLDAAYRLTFSGGITHSSTGIVGNGSTGYYDTNINALSVLSQDDVSTGVYTRNNVSEDKVDIGYFEGGDGSLQINTRNASDLFFSRIISDTSTTVSNTDSRGFFSVSRDGASSAVMSKNTTQTSKTTTSDTLPSLNIYGLCMNDRGTAGFFSTRQQAFSYVGTSLTNTELDNYYNSVQTFQTSLSREV